MPSYHPKTVTDSMSISLVADGRDSPLTPTPPDNQTSSLPGPNFIQRCWHQFWVGAAGESQAASGDGRASDGKV